MGDGKREMPKRKREARARVRGREPRTILAVQVQPRAKRTEIVGWHGDAIKIRVAAPPVQDAANRALARFIAEKLNLGRDAVSISSGKSARRKYVVVRGMEREAILAALSLGSP